jgi:hypothetical protein
LAAVGGTPLIHFQIFLNALDLSMPEETNKPAPQSTEPKPDAGQQARAKDVVDALVEIRAWQDSQRKAEAEAEQAATLKPVESN